MAKAFDYARLAEMNPTMAPLRYFPPEHLAAVYVPLIIPLFIPIVSGLKNGFRDYMNKGGKWSNDECERMNVWKQTEWYI